MLFTRKNKILDEFGFYTDQDGILNRLWRENGGWNNHLENTKKYIQKSFENIATKSKVAILGSGWLLDVPIKELSENFSEVSLFDVIHPKEIKEKIKRYKNVACVDADLTGGYIKAVYEQTVKIRKEGKLSLLDLNVPIFDFSAFDFVVSVNILNQLDIILTDYLIQFGLYTSDEFKAFRTQIQQQHISALPLNKTCLITDFEEIIIDDSGESITKNLIWASLPDGKNKEVWQWNFDTCKTYYEGRKTLFNVVAINF